MSIFWILKKSCCKNELCIPGTRRQVRFLFAEWHSEFAPEGGIGQLQVVAAGCLHPRPQFSASMAAL